MERSNYSVSDVIEFVRNSDEECSSTIDSDEEVEILVFTPIERPELETDCDSDGSVDEKEELVHHMLRRLLTAPCSTNIKQNLGVTDEKSTADESSDEKY